MYARTHELTIQRCDCLPGSETLSPVAKRLTFEHQQNRNVTERYEYKT